MLKCKLQALQAGWLLKELEVHSATGAQRTKVGYRRFLTGNISKVRC